MNSFSLAARACRDTQRVAIIDITEDRQRSSRDAARPGLAADEKAPPVRLRLLHHDSRLTSYYRQTR